MKKILLLALIAVLAMLTLASCAWIGGEGDCAHEVTMALGTGKAATCSEEGLTTGKKCADCGATIEEQKAIPKLEHSIETIAAIKGTCNKEGFTSGEQCSVCGEVTKAPTSTGFGHIYDDNGECTLCGGGNQGGNEGGNQGGNEGGNDEDPDGVMDPGQWDTDI